MPNTLKEKEKKLSHTPGPWSVGLEINSARDLVYIRIESLTGNVGTTGVYGHKSDGSTAGVRYTDRFGVERYRPVISDAECRANAHLIAAAPDLLEALEQALSDIEHSNGLHNLDIVVEEKIAAAIRKAKGGGRDDRFRTIHANDRSLH